jgi:hypothetical protein
MRSTKFAVTLAALALGTALTTLPALAQDYHYPLGRGANDGGTSSAQLNNGEQTSGSAANREANRSNSDTYMFGAQGQPPRTAR